MSETSKKQNYVWYKLSGESESALQHIIKTQETGATISDTDLKKYGEKLGYFFPVAQKSADHFYAVFPVVFGHPASRTDEFYLRAPIGHQRNIGITHFRPDGGILLNDKEIKELEAILFSPQGAGMPILERPSVRLTSPPPPHIK